MRRVVAAVVVVMLASAGVAVSTCGVAGAASARPRLTPVVVAPVSPFAPIGVVGTDGALHVLYELQLTNTQAVAAPLTQIEVRGLDPRSSVVVFEGAELAARLRTLGGQPAAEPVIPASSQLLLLVDIAFASAGDVPLALQHRITFGPTSATATERTSTAARIDLTPAQAPTLGPPVDGANWVITNGCCSPLSPHRTAILPTDAGLSVAERFAVDFRQMDEAGRFVVDDTSVRENYAGYGVNVLSVAPGRVVAVVDGYPEQTPGVPPAPEAFTPDTNEGNSVVVDLGDGTYAFYGQLQAGSIIVREGDRVRRGQALARLGNSGNSLSPHLHFHLMTGESVIGSDGVPFVFNRFGYSGQIDPARLAESGLFGAYGDNRFPVPMTRARQLPLDLAILDFVASPGSAGNPLA
jgi:hypothetical protein